MDMYQKEKLEQKRKITIKKNGNLLYESINKEVVMKKIEDRYTNNIFENIKHIDEYENEYWYARELSKVL